MAEDPKEEKPPQARVWIEQGILNVQAPLFMPNGEFIALGMLQKGSQMVEAFFRHIQREAAKDRELESRILTPIGVPRNHA